MLALKSQRKLALRTHRGALLQKHQPHETNSVPGYFEEAMEQLIHDLKEVATYLDDILINGSSAEELLQTLLA